MIFAAMLIALVGGQVRPPTVVGDPVTVTPRPSEPTMTITVLQSNCER